MKNLLFLLLIPVLAFGQGKVNTIMIKSIETTANFAGKERVLFVMDENNEIQKTATEKYDKKGIPINMKALKEILDGYMLKGYNIISVNSVAYGQNITYSIETTYILRKTD